MKIRDFISTIDVRSCADVFAELPATNCLLASTFGSECLGIEIYEDVVSLYDHLTISKITYRRHNLMKDNVIIIINFK